MVSVVVLFEAFEMVDINVVCHAFPDLIGAVCDFFGHEGKEGTGGEAVLTDESTGQR